MWRGGGGGRGVTRCLKQKANRLESSSCSVCGGGGWR